MLSNDKEKKTPLKGSTVTYLCSFRPLWPELESGYFVFVVWITYVFSKIYLKIKTKGFIKLHLYGAHILVQTSERENKSIFNFSYY
jgi:hypothetical protein